MENSTAHAIDVNAHATGVKVRATGVKVEGLYIIIKNKKRKYLLKRKNKERNPHYSCLGRMRPEFFLSEKEFLF